MLDDMFDDLDRLEDEKADEEAVREITRQKALDERAAAWREARAAEKRQEAEREEAARQESRQRRVAEREAARNEARRQEAESIPSLGDLLASLDAHDDLPIETGFPEEATVEVAVSGGRRVCKADPIRTDGGEHVSGAEVLRVEDMLAMLDFQDEAENCEAESGNSGAAVAADDDEWVVRYEGGVAVRHAMDVSSELLAVKYAGDIMRGTRDGEWLALTSESGFMSLGCPDGKGFFRDGDGDVLLVQTSRKLPPADAACVPNPAADAERLAARQRLYQSCGRRWPGLASPGHVAEAAPLANASPIADALLAVEASTPPLADLLASLDGAECAKEPQRLSKLGETVTENEAHEAAQQIMHACGPMAFVPMSEDHIAAKNERRARLDAKAREVRERRQRKTQEAVDREMAKQQCVQMPKKVPIGGSNAGASPGQRAPAAPVDRRPPPAAPPSAPAPKPRTKDFGKGLKGGFLK